MEPIAVALFFLLAVVVSGALARMSPVPVPLQLVPVQIEHFEDHLVDIDRFRTRRRLLHQGTDARHDLQVRVQEGF